jgi:hypothetical protein
LSSSIIDGMARIVPPPNVRFYGTDVLYRTVEFVHRL